MKKYIVRLYNGLNNQWLDITDPISMLEAVKVWYKKMQKGTKIKSTTYNAFDYYEIFPSDTLERERELRPCSFCESNRVELHRNFDYVYCKFCGARGSYFDGHPEDAISTWNKRAKLDRVSEICICAAIITEDGTIIRGHRHRDCYETAKTIGKKITREQGFITSKNRYVGREEGARLQIKAKIWSIWTRKAIKGILFSEDLY